MSVVDNVVNSIKDAYNSGLNKLTSSASALIRDPTAMSQYMGNYRFPSDLTSGAGRNFYIDIQFRKYQRRSIFNQPFLQASGGIQLPIPTNLRESLRVDWRDGGDAVSGAMIESLLGKTNNLENITGNGAIDIAKTTATSIAAGLGAGAIGKIVDKANIIPGLGTAGLQLVGRAQNPFLTKLFKQPTFKEYSFTWRLAPRNAQESETVKQIISAFKANMLPAMQPGAAGVLLTYPNMAIVSLYPAEDFLFKFKPCVVTDFGVDYTDGGMPSFFRGTNAPTLISIRVNLTEIEYWLREDIVDPSLRTEGALFGTTVNTGQAQSTNPLPEVTGNARGPR